MLQRKPAVTHVEQTHEGAALHHTAGSKVKGPRTSDMTVELILFPSNNQDKKWQTELLRKTKYLHEICGPDVVEPAVVWFWAR